VFLVANYEGGDLSVEAQINPDSALMSHEWMETVVRLALMLHGKEKVVCANSRASSAIVDSAPVGDSRVCSGLFAQVSQRSIALP
jgi:hypothetical protein